MVVKKALVTQILMYYDCLVFSRDQILQNLFCCKRRGVGKTALLLSAGFRRIFIAIKWKISGK
jgi:hypothetical protein